MQNLVRPVATSEEIKVDIALPGLEKAIVATTATKDYVPIPVLVQNQTRALTVLAKHPPHPSNEDSSQSKSESPTYHENSMVVADTVVTNGNIWSTTGYFVVLAEIEVAVRRSSKKMFTIWLLLQRICWTFFTTHRPQQENQKRLNSSTDGIEQNYRGKCTYNQQDHIIHAIPVPLFP